MSGAVFHRLDRDTVLRELRSYATGELAARPEVLEVTLIGSLARGDWSARSDADLVVVVRNSDLPARARVPAYLPDRHLGVPLDVLVYTADESRAWSPRFAAEVGRGIVLFRRDPPGTEPTVPPPTKG